MPRAVDNSSPVGQVISRAANTVPAGYLLCDGSAVSRTTYAVLFALIGVTHGSGNGTTTFNIPDYRGAFLRGHNGAKASPAGRFDPEAAGRVAMATGGVTGNNVGSVQLDATALNGLDLTDPGHAHRFPSNAAATFKPYGDASTTFATSDFSSGTGAPATHTLTQNVTTGISIAGDLETRPYNAYVAYYIRF